jgi:hypothetical protein
VVTWCGGADDSDARVACKLDEGVSHAAVGAVNEDGLTGVDLCFFQHLPCGDAVEHHGLGLRGVETVRNRYQVACDDQCMGRPSSGLDDRSGATADQRLVHLGTDGRDHADEVIAQYKGELWLVQVAAAPHLLLGKRHAGGQHLDERLAFAGGWYRPLVNVEALRPYDAGKHDLGEHGCGG